VQYRTLLKMAEFRITIKDKKCVTDLSKLLVDLKDGIYLVDIYSDEGKTNQQLRYYKGPLIKCLMDYTGYSKSECDCYFKTKHLEVETIRLNSEVYTVLPSLKNIKKVKLAEFIKNVVEDLEVLGLNPPLI